MTEKEKQMRCEEFWNNDEEISKAKTHARMMCQKLKVITAKNAPDNR